MELFNGGSGVRNNGTGRRGARALRRTGVLALGSAVVAGSLLGAGAAYAAPAHVKPSPAPVPVTGRAGGAEVRIVDWSSHATLKPGGKAETFILRVHNDTGHTLEHVRFGYSTYAPEQPVLKELSHGTWKKVPWGHTPEGKRGEHSFAGLGERTVKKGATVSVKVRVSLPRHWDRKVTHVKAEAGAEGKGWTDFKPVDFKVAEAR
ncbi:hypothetical protein [Streptomyces sp. NPDC093109]|uniref:hypothetical protein n=1 Tax=Streptomyces sp. NPDC093109 TaxID=3154977 RepID=UPI00344DFF14